MIIKTNIPLVSFDFKYCSFSKTYLVRINKIYKIEVNEWLKIVLEGFFRSLSNDQIYKNHYTEIGKTSKEIKKIREQFNENLKSAVEAKIYVLIAEGRSKNYIIQKISKLCNIKVDLEPFFNNQSKIDIFHNKNKNKKLIGDWNSFPRWKLIQSKLGIIISLMLFFSLPILAIELGFTKDIELLFNNIISGTNNFILPRIMIIAILLRFIFVPIHEFGHEYFYRIFGGNSGTFYINKSGIVTFAGSSDIDDTMFIKRKWKRSLIGMGGIVSEFIFSVIIYLLLKIIEIQTGYFALEIFYYLIIRFSFSIFVNMNFLQLESDGYQILTNIIDFPTLKETTTEYLQSIVSGRKMKILMNSRQKKFVIGYLISAISFITIFSLIQIIVLQIYLQMIISDPMIIFPINLIVNSTDTVFQIILLIGMTLTLLMAIDIFYIVYQQKQKIQTLIFLLKIRKIGLSDVLEEKAKLGNYSGNYILLENNPDINLSDVPSFFRIFLLGEGTKNKQLDSKRTFFQKIESEKNKNKLVTNKRLTLSELSIMINEISFSYVKGDFFDLIPILKESLLHHENRIEFLKYSQDIKYLKRKEDNNNSKAKINTENKDESTYNTFTGSYCIFNNTELTLEEIPKNMQILLLGEGVRNIQLNHPKRTYSCSHCSRHRQLETSNPRSYLDLTEMIASKSYFIIHGPVYLLANILIDAVITLKEFESDGSELIELTPVIAN